MVYIIYLFGLLTLIVGIFIMIKPAFVYEFFGRYSGSMGIYVLAVVVRVVIGIALIVCSEKSKFPLTFQIIGGASIISGLIMMLIGRTRFAKMISWAIKVPSLYKRMGGFAALLFGAFLIYGVA